MDWISSSRVRAKHVKVQVWAGMVASGVDDHRRGRGSQAEGGNDEANLTPVKEKSMRCHLSSG